MLGMHFDNVSFLSNPVAAAYVHLAASSVTITCLKSTIKSNVNGRQFSVITNSDLD